MLKTILIVALLTSVTGMAATAAYLAAPAAMKVAEQSSPIVDETSAFVGRMNNLAPQVNVEFSIAACSPEPGDALFDQDSLLISDTKLPIVSEVNREPNATTSKKKPHVTPPAKMLPSRPISTPVAPKVKAPSVAPTPPKRPTLTPLRNQFESPSIVYIPKLKPGGGASISTFDTK